MKTYLSSRNLFILSFALLVATNIIVLAGVASNRSGEPDTRITLSERELQLPYRVHEDNSGLTLRLTWRSLTDSEDAGYSYWRSPHWLNEEKLRELGFEIDDSFRQREKQGFYKERIPKEVYIVLENNGEPYREAVRRTETLLEKAETLYNLQKEDKKRQEAFKIASERLLQERKTKSRLFAIDAGLDPGILRKKYEDRARFIITKGLVKAEYDYNQKRKTISGYISKLTSESIHVPLQHRSVLDSVLARNISKMNEFQEPRYEVELAYGGRLEPWVVTVRPLEGQSNN